MTQKKILVTGANGQLGKEFRDLETRYPQYQFTFTSHADLPIEDKDAVEKFFGEQRFTACINCAAYTAVDKAEMETAKARLINADAVGFLAEASHRYHTAFIHFSTDYVFDGHSSTAYVETDQTNPVNEYGVSKLLGEQKALKCNPASIVIRTSWVYSHYGNNFVKTMMRLMKERESINVVNDQVGSPTYAADLAEATMRILLRLSDLKKSGTVQNGVFHYSNEGVISWFEFASAIKQLSGSHCRVNPIPTTQYPTPAKRPQYSLLNKSKIKSTFGLEIPFWKDSLVRCIERIRNTENA